MNEPESVAPPAEPEVQALEQLVQRLQGFGSSLHVEWLDGALTALAVGPWQPPIDNWLGPILGEEFERACADPLSVAEAAQAVGARLATLRRQLEAERLMDTPDFLRLEPLIYDFSEGPEPEPDPEPGAAPAADDPAVQAFLQGGAMWAEGFLDGVQLFPDVWAEPADTEARALLVELLADIEALLKPTPEEAAGDEEVSPRDLAIERALFAAQDLRVFWLDHAPKPPPRRVEATPGRNDPCPCGSGKKFKKCHGAAA
jgi:uncharacterized protein